MKRVVLFLASMLIVFLSCTPEESIVYYDVTEIYGEWVESYEDFPDFQTDATEYHTFQDNGIISNEQYNNDGRLHRSRDKYTYSEGIISVNPGSEEEKYTITKLTDDEMEWQRVGTIYSEGSVGTDFKHFKRPDSDTKPYASHYFISGHKIMFGEYDVQGVICFESDMPEHLIEPANEKIGDERKFQDGSRFIFNQDKTYILKEADQIISTGTYEIGVYAIITFEEECYYYPYRPGRNRSKGYMHLTDDNGEKFEMGMYIADHEDPEINYATLWPYEGFGIVEGDWFHSFGIRYGLTFSE